MAYPIKFNSTTKVTIGPFVSTDGITPYAGGNNVLIENADEAELLKHGAVTTSPLTTANNTVSAIANCDGYYALNLVSADTDTYGNLFIVIQDDSLYMPFRMECQVMNSDAYDAMFSASNPYALSSEIADTRSDIAVVADDAAGTRSDLNNGTDGLGAIKAVVDAAATAAELAGTRSDLAIVDANVDTLVTQAADTRSDIAVVDANVDTLITESAEQTSDIDVLVTQMADTRSDIAALDIPSVQSDLAVITGQIADTRSDIAVADANIDTILANYATAADIAGTRSDIAIVDGNVDTLVTQMADTRSDIAVVDANVDTMVSGIITGSAQTGTLSTTQATTDLSGYTDDQLIGRIITVTSGVADGESSDITDYAEASGLLTFTAMTLAMGNGDTFKIT